MTGRKQMDSLSRSPCRFLHLLRVLRLKCAAKTLHDHGVLVLMVRNKPAEVRSPVADIGEHRSAKGHGDFFLLHMPPDLGTQMHVSYLVMQTGTAEVRPHRPAAFPEFRIGIKRRASLHPLRIGLVLICRLAE